jgi:chorismate mutase/prephenate dehydratase
MAKAKPTDHKPSKDSPAKAPTLAGLRGQVDHIDRELVNLINQRAKLAHKIGQIKETAGQQTYDPVREEEVLAHQRVQ